MSEINKSSAIAKNSVILILCENGIGSLLHAFHIPLAGHLLSINQIGIMARSNFQTKERDSSLIIAFNSSFLKSLSPAGKKLTPMLAILAQGIFFTLPNYLIGFNFLAFMIGTILSSLWAFIQPILFIYIMFGNKSINFAEKLLKGIENYIPHFEDWFIWIVAALIILKIVAAIIYSFVLIKFSDEKLESIIAQLPQKKRDANANNSKYPASIQALKELMNPLFIISFFIMAIFFYFTESSMTGLIWNLCRPIAIGFILFYSFKLIPMTHVIHRLKKLGLIRLASSLEQTITLLKKQ